ncbi:hypothetical protein GCK72_005462 [Caenorhabditis remanei]|uniref:Homeobox domain-containing protein n=1 Tax=Caenorhabditis remanei TaxID=31234 RepID=A0A6A5HCL8_CAERE|nr:hypothetical protein GCK72_005462 [Caenorhabditis remanei]KAF1765510.1 hypothetical protein GCK72_005462 [Caenorhabditis remanei]
MLPPSAFHPYTRPTATNNLSQDMSLSEENLRLLRSAETLLALSQLQGSAKLALFNEPTQQMSPPLPAPVLTPNPTNSPSSPVLEYAIHSPAASIPNEKSRRKRTTFSPEQATRLESEYLGDSYMAREKRLLLAQSLSLSENQVKTWFQNRRAKDKRDRKTENSSNHSRKSSPSRKSSSDSSPTPSLMTPTTTPFILTSSHQIQTATSPTTVDLLPSTPPASKIQKIEQFTDSSQSLIPSFDLLNTYLQSLSAANVPLQSLLTSSPPIYDPSLLAGLQSPLQSAII